MPRARACSTQVDRESATSGKPRAMAAFEAATAPVRAPHHSFSDLQTTVSWASERSWRVRQLWFELATRSEWCSRQFGRPLLLSNSALVVRRSARRDKSLREARLPPVLPQGAQHHLQRLNRTPAHENFTDGVLVDSGRTRRGRRGVWVLVWRRSGRLWNGGHRWDGRDWRGRHGRRRNAVRWDRGNHRQRRCPVFRRSWRSDAPGAV